MLSPSGKYLAVTTPVNGRLNLAVVDMESRKGAGLTSFSNYDVRNVVWVGDDRLLFSVGQANSPTGPGQFDGGGLFVISRDGKESRVLSKTIREQRNARQNVRTMEFARRIPGSTDEVIVTGNLRSADSEDVYRLNLNTGKTKLISEDRPEHAGNWILDANLVPRVVTSWVRNTQTYVVHYRKSADAPWQELVRTDRTKSPAFVPLGILKSDNKTLLVATNQGRDTMAVFKYDPETKTLGELLAQHPHYDMGADAAGDHVGGVITEPETDRLLGYSVDADKPQRVWIDEKEAQTQAMVDSALPDTVNSFRRFPNQTRLLISAFSDIKSQRWYILDEGKRTMEELFAAKPWMDGNYVQQRPFIYKTRDGLEIPGYYFLPANYKPGDKLPTIVHIHGGPHVRADHWGSGFGVMEGQLYASRGYAVLVPNYRITPGLGGKIFTAGFGTVGRQMSEDHEDATQWAIDQGFADPARICMSGASYGGYATLRALAKTPDLYKCGVAGLVVSDLELQLTSPNGDTAGHAAGVEFWHRLVGQDASHPTALRDNSPVYQADKMKAPLFIYAGADDIRTPVEQANNMVKALKAAGHPPKEVVIKAEEGHGYGRAENNVDLYERILKFLDEQIGASNKH